MDLNGSSLNRVWVNVGHHVFPMVWGMTRLSGVREIIPFLLGEKYLLDMDSGQLVHDQDSARYTQLGRFAPRWEMGRRLTSTFYYSTPLLHSFLLPSFQFHSFPLLHFLQTKYDLKEFISINEIQITPSLEMNYITMVSRSNRFSLQ